MQSPDKLSIYASSSFSMKEYKNVNAHLHANLEMEIVVVYEGVLNMRIDGKEYSIGKNNAVIIFPFETHDFRSIQDNRSCVIMFTERYSDYFFKKVSRATPVKRIFYLSETICSYLKEQYDSKNLFSELFCFGILLPLFNSIKTACTFSKEIVFDNLFLDTLVYINNHLSENVTEKDIAKNLFVNTVSLSRAFSKNAKMNIRQYINQRRVIIAYSSLQSGENATDVAYKTGFGSVRSFNRAFKAYFNFTPSSVKN